MKYVIGQKVTTPLGVGLVGAIDKDLKGNTLIAVNIGKLSIDYIGISFKESDIKPYRTPHEKLIDMGYEYVEHKQGHRYKHKEKEDYIDIDLLRSSYYHFTFKYERHYRMSALPLGTTLELSRILTEYLEWLEEEK